MHFDDRPSMADDGGRLIRVQTRWQVKDPDCREVFPAGAETVVGNASGLHQLKCIHTIAFPVSSAGGEAQAMAAHRQAFPTPRGSGKRDPKGGLARPPASSRAACDAPASRRAALLAGNLARPSYGTRNRASEYCFVDGVAAMFNGPRQRSKRNGRRRVHVAGRRPARSR